MSPSSLRLSLVALAALSTMSACGGGDGATDSASAFVASIAQATPASGRARALAFTAANVDAKALFDWAQYKYPSLFPKALQTVNQPFSYLGVNYTIRGWANGNYLGVTTSGDVWGLGPFNNNVLTKYGTLAGFAADIVADACAVDPANCTLPPVPAGPLNECADAIGAQQQAGFRVHLEYELSGDGVTGELINDYIVDGSATFEGLSATQATNTSSSTTTVADIGAPVTTTSKIKTYGQPGANGLWKTLGSNNEVTSGAIVIPGLPPFPGMTTISKTVFNPPYENLEYTLALGQSISVTTSQTTTTTQPANVPPQTSTYQQTYTFDAKESIGVLGKTYSTCRYLVTSAGGPPVTNWIILGKGIAAKTQSVADGKTTTLQLKPVSTYNGAPF